MALDSGTVAALISGSGALVTVLGATYSSVRSGKDKTDRAADRDVAEATADKLKAERDQITEQTRAQVLQELRTDLDRARKNQGACLPEDHGHDRDHSVESEVEEG
jgi:hypothetical protein